MSRIILIGQAAFGADCLKALVDQNEKVVGVITVPDPIGQAGDFLKESAMKLHLPLIQPMKLKDPDASIWVAQLEPDLLVLAYVTQFVPKKMIDLARFGGINYHPSLLPKYRGGTAMNWAIINGETETGVTIHQIDEGVDSGPILLQEKVAIDPDDTVKSLYFNKLYPLGVKMVAEAVRLIREGKARPIPQDEARSSYQPVIKEKDVMIQWAQPTRKIYDLIRGSNPSPGATTSFRSQKLKIWEGKPHGAQGDPGKVIRLIPNQGFAVATGDGAIGVERVQYQSNVKMPCREFIQTHGLKIGDILGTF